MSLPNQPMYIEYVHSSNYYPTNYAVVPWIPPSANQVVSSSHGLFPWIGNWFGLKFLLQPLIWLIKKIARGVGEAYLTIADNDPVILFFQNMHCICKNFRERYIAQQELYERLELIINYGRNFVFTDLSLVDKYYDEVREKLPDKKLRHWQNVSCVLKSSALYELETSMQRVKQYLEDLTINLNLTGQQKLHLITSLEIIMKHLRFMQLFFNFKKIKELQKNILNVNFFSKKTDNKDEKDAKIQDLKEMFDYIIMLQTKKKEIDKKTQELGSVSTAFV